MLAVIPTYNKVIIVFNAKKERELKNIKHIRPVFKFTEAASEKRIKVIKVSETEGRIDKVVSHF